MIDSEVIRLRRLRNTALRARAIAVALDANTGPRHSIFSRSAVSCWRIARLATGRLRAHPYLSYQRGPSEMRGVCDRTMAALLGTVARYRGQSLRRYSTELQRLSRQLDDARALTWSGDLSDTLGRSQIEVRGLIKEINAGARHEPGSQREAAAAIDRNSGVGTDNTASLAGNWPYLAF